MKSPFASELEANKLITGSFLVQAKEIRQKKTGELYLSLVLGDRTGDLDAKMWDNISEVVDAFGRDDFVKVKGMVQIYHNRPQITLHKIRRMDESEVDFGDYFPCSRRAPDEMWVELRGIVAGIANPHIKALLEALLDDEDVARRYRRAPAAKQIHHAWLGGLIEHVLSLCALARAAAAHYHNIDLDLLLAGVVLHDIGKIYELNYERGFSYSNDGQLLGHINIGMRMVADKLHGLPDFPPSLRVLIEHMILSHHGHLEFGSPKLPQFPEALLLHYLDDLDSKMECMRALIENDRQVEGCFTSYNTAMERAALKKERYLNAAPARAHAAGQPVVGPSEPGRSALAAVQPEPLPATPAVAGQAEPAAAQVGLAGTPAEPGRPASSFFPPRPDSPFASKLKSALREPIPDQEGK
jgi:3'-5' exoribonuclease